MKRGCSVCNAKIGEYDDHSIKILFLNGERIKLMIFDRMPKGLEFWNGKNLIEYEAFPALNTYKNLQCATCFNMIGKNYVAVCRQLSFLLNKFTIELKSSKFLKENSHNSNRDGLINKTISKTEIKKLFSEVKFNRKCLSNFIEEARRTFKRQQLEMNKIKNFLLNEENLN